MKYEVYCVLYTVHQFIEALGMFFLLQLLSAGFAGMLRHSLSLRKDIPWSMFFPLFSLGSPLDDCSTWKAQLSQYSQSPELHQLVNEDFCLLIEAIEITRDFVK